MAKTKKRTVAKTATKETKKQTSLFSQIKWGESYTSLFLGAVVVVISVILIFSFLKERNKMIQETSSTSTSIEQEEALKSIKFKTYTVKAGDDLWHIAQSVYGSGYNWIDIANTNKLENPGVLFAGTKLMLPNVKQRAVEQTQIAPAQAAKPAQPAQPVGVENGRIAGRSYKIQKGDDLWHIAVRAYGDGYKWVEIARVNNLTNPDLIHSDNTIMLPR